MTFITYCIPTLRHASPSPVSLPSRLQDFKVSSNQKLSYVFSIFLFSVSENIAHVHLLQVPIRTEKKCFFLCGVCCPGAQPCGGCLLPAQLSRARGGASAGRHSTGLPTTGEDPACMGCRVPAPAVRPAASARLEGGGQALLRALLGRGNMYGDCQAVPGLQQSGKSRRSSRCGSAAEPVCPGQPCSAIALTELRDMGCCPDWAECLLGKGKACQGEARLQAAHFVPLLGGMEHTW